MLCEAEDGLEIHLWELSQLVLQKVEVLIASLCWANTMVAYGNSWRWVMCWLPSCIFSTVVPHWELKPFSRAFRCWENTRVSCVCVCWSPQDLVFSTALLQGGCRHPVRKEQTQCILREEHNKPTWHSASISLTSQPWQLWGETLLFSFRNLLAELSAQAWHEWGALYFLDLLFQPSSAKER